MCVCVFKAKINGYNVTNQFGYANVTIEKLLSISIKFGRALIQFRSKNNETMCIWVWVLVAHICVLYCWAYSLCFQFAMYYVFKAYEWKMAENIFQTLAMNRTLYSIHWAYGCELLIQSYAEDLKCHCLAFVCFWWGNIVFVFVYNRQKTARNVIVPNISM